MLLFPIFLFPSPAEASSPFFLPKRRPSCTQCSHIVASVRRGAIFFSPRASEARRRNRRRRKVGIKTPLCLLLRGVPLIRRLASAVQRARWKVSLTAAEWRLPSLFCCTKQTNTQPSTKNRSARRNGAAIYSTLFIFYVLFFLFCGKNQ